MNENSTPPEYPQPQQPRRIQLAIPYSKPYATYAVIGVTIFVYILQLAGQYILNLDLAAALGFKVNDLIRQGQLWRLVTPVFLHDSILPYGLLHIGFNMYALYLYGRGVEARLGHGRYLLLYFLSAFAGNVLSFLLTPGNSLGASTAVFGVFAAEAVFIYQNRNLLQDHGRGALLNMLSLVAINLFLGFIIPGVDNFGHLGGILGGALFAWFGGPQWKVEGLYPSMRLIDEREGRGSLAGTIAVLLFFIPLAALGWIWIVK
jgi:rhomboid protease GluP